MSRVLYRREFVGHLAPGWFESLKYFVSLHPRSEEKFGVVFSSRMRLIHD